VFQTGIAPIDYKDPWTEPFEQRVRMLRRREAKQRVAWLYELPDTSTFRYRVHNMIEVLSLTRPDIAAAWFTEAEIEQLAGLIDICDALVICRFRYTHALNHLVTRARNAGVVTAFDCDDLVFDSDYIHLILNTLDQDLNAAAWNHWFAYIGRMGASLRLCERVIVTNDYLADRAVQFAPDKDARVVPNFLNRAQIALSRRIHDAKRTNGWRRDQGLHLGYFSGTPTHNRDFAIAADAIAELMDEDPRITLRLVGFTDFDSALARHADRVDRHPLQDFLNLQRLMGEVELNLVPLQTNEFTNCKSELKYFEAAVAGTLTVASPSFTFVRAIQDGMNGYLALSHQWGEAMRRAIEQMDRYPEMAERAFAHVRSTYFPEAQTEAILAALFEPRGRIEPSQKVADCAALVHPTPC
jgi:glycosyltransferase involved in cell wall biosynthesis